MHGHVIRSFYYHPVVLYTAVSGGAYMLSQTVWRLRGKKGRVLHYSQKWLISLLVLLIVNCAVRNILWFQFKIPI
jgi:hypothetical protein